MKRTIPLLISHTRVLRATPALLSQMQGAPSRVDSEAVPQTVRLNWVERRERDQKATAAIASRTSLNSDTCVHVLEVGSKASTEAVRPSSEYPPKT